MTRSTTLHILIVDGDSATLALVMQISHALVGPAAEIAAVLNVAGAARHSLRHPVDVIVVQLKVHDRQGLDAIWHLRSIFPIPPIVVLADEISEEMHIQLLALGAVHLVRNNEELAGALATGLKAAIRQINEMKRARTEELTQIGAILALVKGLDTMVRANSSMLIGNGEPTAGLVYRIHQIWQAYRITAKVVCGVGWAMLVGAAISAIGVAIQTLWRPG